MIRRYSVDSNFSFGDSILLLIMQARVVNSEKKCPGIVKPDLKEKGEKKSPQTSFEFLYKSQISSMCDPCVTFRV